MRRALAALAAAVTLIAIAPASASAAKLPGDFYGVVSQGTMSPYDAFLMNQAGVDTLRFHFDWRNHQYEPGRCQASADVGVCDWRQLDYAIGLMAAADIRAFPFFLNVPTFISEFSNTPPVRTVAARRAWVAFVQAAVRRYGRDGQYWKRYFPDQFPDARPKPITHWEVWNEPSDGSYWEPKPDPVEYARLLKITGRAIHAAEEKADVVFAGLFGTPTEDNNGIKAFKYYRKAFAQRKIGRFFDDVGVHPYGPTMKRLQVQMGWVLEEMKAAGFRKRDIWVTEIAWSSAEPPTILGVGPEGQAQMLKRSFRYFRENQRRWNIEGLHWYAYSDLPPGYPLCEFCEQAGLVDFDRNLKPSYHAFRAIAG